MPHLFPTGRRKEKKMQERFNQALRFSDQPQCVYAFPSAQWTGQDDVNFWSQGAQVGLLERTGIQILHDPQDAVVDIVFVHGLTGDRVRTWTFEQDGFKCLWPQQLLPYDMPNCRIITWGYDADVVRLNPFHTVSTNDIEKHATQLCSNLQHLRSWEQQTRPLVFIAHSLGGIIVKAALLHSAEATSNQLRHLKSISDSTRGVLFLGTPHSGSSKAQWAYMAVSLISVVRQTNKELLRRLESDDPLLYHLQSRFVNLLHTRDQSGSMIAVTCAYEEKPMAVFGKVVNDSSAVLPGYPTISMYGGHTDMAKFRSRQSQKYLDVVEELKRWVYYRQSPSSASPTGLLTPPKQSGNSPWYPSAVAESGAPAQSLPELDGSLGSCVAERPPENQWRQGVPPRRPPFPSDQAQESLLSPSGGPWPPNPQQVIASPSVPQNPPSNPQPPGPIRIDDDTLVGRVIGRNVFSGTITLNNATFN